MIVARKRATSKDFVRFGKKNEAPVMGASKQMIPVLKVYLIRF